MSFAFYLYIIVVVTLHIVPLNGTTLGSVNSIEFGPLRADYLLHSLLFLPWMPLFNLQFHRTRPRLTKREVPRRHNLAWLLLGIFVAGGLEITQYWIPQRSL